jgi:hypothetical protein
MGTTIDTTGAYINITVHNTIGYLATLWNGTHTFTGGVNESITAITGLGWVLNYTTMVYGEYTVRATMEKPGYLNTTMITEGFTVTNVTINITLNPMTWVNASGVYNVNFACFYRYEQVPGTFNIQFTDVLMIKGSTVMDYAWDYGDGTPL